MPKHRLFYYTGTGNSLWVARELAKRLGNAELTDLVPTQDDPKLDAEAIGIVFPVHMWGLPKRIVEFVERLPKASQRYFFAVAVNAGEPAGTLLQLNKLLAARGATLSSGFSVPLPSNYIPWGGPGPKEDLERTFAAAREKVASLAEAVKARRRLPPEKGPGWQNVLYSKLIYPMSYPYVSKMDKDFWADEKCNGCKVCARICPALNIEMRDGKPKWQQHCEQCLACIQWCPREAIQYGKKTPNYPRYHHPEVRISDIYHRSPVRASNRGGHREKQA
jgi:Fe-S-cluster-containing hydrogenase component 2